MKTIEIDDDLYEELRQEARLGESTTALFRRMLKFSGKAKTVSKAIGENEVAGYLNEILMDSSFRAERNVTTRFLAVLSWLHLKKREAFHEVIQLKGTKRRYFAASQRELEESGSSVHPQKIPGSPYWVVTNNDTSKKQRILIDAMRLLGYSMSESARLADALEQ